jgi:uracil-DNA glycosylase
MNPAAHYRELLLFYLEAGVDAATGDVPVDRFGTTEPGEGIPPTDAASAHVGPSQRLEGTEHGTDAADQVFWPQPAMLERARPDDAVMAAREVAKRAASLEALRALVQSFEGCALKATAKRLVFADGNPDSRVMFVGEAPGREEDLEGLPFVGRSGKLLDRMMAAIGLDRSSAYIANIIPWRPPGNRTPSPQEAAICLPFILRQIELADPDILVCLGGPAAQALLGTSQGIMRTRGRWLPYQTGSREIRAIATLHPAYLLRQPLHKRLAWRDFLAIRRALETS